jgi:hypothetical protein
VLTVETDHCIDNLRQKIMCDCDMTYMMSYWVKDRKLAMPDFAVQHRCLPCEAKLRGVAAKNIDTPLLVPSPGEKVWTRPEHP